MNIFNIEEFSIIKNKFGGSAILESTNVCCESEDFFTNLKHNISTDRRGEVVFCVIRPGGKIITITCPEYPSGIFRIPTGGLGHNEDIISALKREIGEELGLTADIKTFVGAINITFLYGSESELFHSYIFILNETGGRLLLDASDDEVSEVLEVNVDELSEVSENLLKIEDSWKDWGKFRYITTNAVYRFLKDVRL
ncbi:MAG TPA: NUDIX domain-containing protein [Clostridia bacterium]